MKFRFIDILAFINTNLDKAVKNLGEVNNCFCLKCNKVQEIFKGKLLPIDQNRVLKYQPNVNIVKIYEQNQLII